MTNRERKQQATKHKFWCFRCDTALVGEFGKCPNCGKRHSKGRKKLKVKFDNLES